MKLLVLGGSGLVGSRFVLLKSREFEIVSPSHQEFDLLDFQKYPEFIKNISPDVLINFAAFTNVDLAEAEKDQIDGLVYKLNVEAPKKLKEVANDLKLHLIHLSTDYVFDGTKSDSPYTENDNPNPVSWYAKTKFLGEEAVKTGKNFTIARIEMPFSPKFDKKKDVARIFLELLKNGQNIIATSDQKITPTFVDFGVEAISKLAQLKVEGIFHIASTGFTTPYDFAKIIAREFDLDGSFMRGTLKASLIEPVSFEEFSQTRVARRPKDSWLNVSKFESHFGKNILKSVEESINSFKLLL